MRLWASIILVLCLLPNLVPAQELVFCLDHTREGAPLARNDEFDLERFGQELDFLYRSQAPIVTSKLYFFIDIMQPRDNKEDTAYVEFDTKSLSPEHGAMWAATRYRFDRSGRYRVLVLNEQKAELCRAEVLVNLQQEIQGPEYYEGSLVAVCNTAPNGNPDTLLAETLLKTGESKAVTVLLKHKRPLNTSKIFVDVWVGSGDGAGIYLETMEFRLDPGWSYTQFDYELKAAGVYTFRVYNEDEIWMTNGSLEVMME